MPIYDYSARNRAGVVTRGTIEAESDAEAVAQLREQGLWVTHLRSRGAGAPATGVSPLAIWWTGVSLKDQAVFFRQLSALVNAGMPLARALMLLKQQTANRRLGRIVADLLAHVQAGGNLSDAFRRHPAVFRPLTISLLEAGEAGGLLDQVLGRLADYLEREHELRQSLRWRTLWTKLQIAALILVPPLPLLVLEGVGAYLRAVAAVVLPVALVLGVIWVVVRFLLQFAAFRAGWDTVKLVLPIVGKSARQFAEAKLFRAMAMLYGAGVPVGRTLRLSADASDNAAIGAAVRRQAARVEQGEPLTAALQATGLFSPTVLGMVATGEQAGDLETMLTKVADYQEQEAETRTRQLVIALPVVLLAIMAVIVATMLARFYLGFYGGLMAEE